jgi:hypothetical protein
VAKVAKGVAKGASEIAKGNVKQGLKRIGQAYIDVARYSTGFHIVNERGEKIFGKETWNTIVVTGAVIAVTVATGGAGAPALATALFSGAAGGFTGRRTECRIGRWKRQRRTEGRPERRGDWRCECRTFLWCRSGRRRRRLLRQCYGVGQ